MVSDFSQKDATDAVKYLSYAVGQTDDLVINCVSAYTSLGAGTKSLKPYVIFLNLLYNAGYMTTDAINIMEYQNVNAGTGFNN